MVLTQELANLLNLGMVLKSQVNSSKNMNQFCQCACDYYGKMIFHLVTEKVDVGII